jgi:hypothetical protein
MSNIPIDEFDLGEPATMLTEQEKRRTTVSKAKNVADRDARVAGKNNSSNGVAKKPVGKKNQPAAPAPQSKNAANNNAEDDGQPTKLTQTTLNIPVQWVITPQSQALEAQAPVGDILKAHGIPEGDISVLSAHLRQNDNTINGQMPLTIKGLKAKGEIVVNGRDTAQNPYTVILPRESHFHANGDSKGIPLYVRGNDVDPQDYADHLNVDVDKLKTVHQPYWGEQGKMAKTHIEVHEAANKDLYDILATSTGVESMFEGGDRKNPSLVVSKVDHRRVVDKYLADGGYKRAARVNPNQITFELHHFGTKPGDDANENAFDTAANLPGLSQQQRDEMASQRASHRVFAEVALTFAHKPADKADPQEKSN